MYRINLADTCISHVYPACILHLNPADPPLPLAPCTNPVSKSGKPREENTTRHSWVGVRCHPSPGVIMLMNTGPYRPLNLWGPHVTIV